MYQAPKRQYMFFLILLLMWSVPLFAQQSEQFLQDEMRKFHLFGLSAGIEKRVLTEDDQTNAKDVASQIGIAGINYTSLIGSRLGYYSDLYIQLPVDTGKWGIFLDYTGGVGWNIWYGNWGLLPGIGFHAGYTSLPAEEFSEDEKTYYLSFGLGAGIKILYRLTDSLILFGGASGNYDTLEFSPNPRYRNRKNSFERSFDYKGSLGIGIAL